MPFGAVAATDLELGQAATRPKLAVILPHWGGLAGSRQELSQKVNAAISLSLQSRVNLIRNVTVWGFEDDVSSDTWCCSWS
jgi:hypothetical protein